MLHRTTVSFVVLFLISFFTTDFSYAQTANSFLPAQPYDASDAPEQITEASSLDNAGDEVTSAARYGNHIYMAANSPAERLQIYDITDPLSPVFLNDNLAVENISKVFVYDGHLYITTHSWQSTNPTIHVLDLSNPTAPALVGQYQPGHWIVQLGFQGNYMFVFYQDGIRVVDITDPSTPQTESSYTWGINGVTPVRMSLPAGDYLYYTFYNEVTNSGSVHILDISDKSNVQEVADISTGSHHPGGIWADNTLMIYSTHKQSGSDYDAYLHAWDVTNKANPTELQGDYQISDKGQSLGVNMVDGVLMASINTEEFPATANGSDGDKVWAGAWDGSSNSFVFGTEFETPHPGYLDLVIMDDEISRSSATVENSLLCDFFYIWLLSFNWESFDFTGTNKTKLLKLGYRCLEQTTYTLTIVQQPFGASGVCSTDPAEGTHIYDEGEEVMVTATAGGDWQFSGWEGDGVKQGNSITVVMDADKTVTVTYTEQPPGSFMLTTGVEPPAAQSECTMTPTDGTYEDGAQVELSAQPGMGWLFMEWQGNASGSDNPTTIIMDGDKDVVAFFQPTLELDMSSPEKQITCPPYETLGTELATALLTAMGTDWILNGIKFDVITPFDLQVTPELDIDFSRHTGQVVRNAEGKIIQFVFTGIGAELSEGEVTTAELSLVFDYESKLADGHAPGPIPGLPVTLHVKTHKSLLTAEPKPEDARPGVVTSNEWYSSNEQIVADIYNTRPDDEGYETIVDAIAAAANGETIVVCPGFYEESFTIDLPLTVRSAYDSEIPGHFDTPREKGKKDGIKLDYDRVFRTQLKPSDTQGTTVTCLADNITLEGFRLIDNFSPDKPSVEVDGTAGSAANLTIRSNSFNETATAIHAYGGGVTNAHIYDNEFARVEDGIIIDSSAAANVIGHTDPDSVNSFLIADYAIILSNTTGNQVLNNEFSTAVSFIPLFTEIGVLLSDAEQNTITGNFLGESKDAAVYLERSHKNTISENFIGYKPGNAVNPNNVGVELFESSENLVDRNIFAGNKSNDIVVSGSGSFANIITGNEVGVVIDGGNTFHGAAETSILLNRGANTNTVGGLFPSNRNVLLGGKGDGIAIRGEGTEENSILGNDLGSPATFDRYGIDISGGASSNLISSNTITYCDSAGIRITDTEAATESERTGANAPQVVTDANTISSNFIFDGHQGIELNGAGVTNTVISSNSVYNMRSAGISLLGAVGTDIGEGDGGVNYIGSTQSSSDMDGIFLNEDEGTEIRNAVIGYVLPKTDEGAGEPTPGGPSNGLFAVETQDLLIDNCRFSNCRADGITISSGGTGITITNSKFGLDLDDEFAQFNQTNGISLAYTDSVRIGGAGAGNVIANNYGNGIYIKSSEVEPDITISHNLIGLEPDGVSAPGNGQHGIKIEGSTSVTITENTISGNSKAGLNALGFSYLIINNNRFGTDSSGTALVGNGAGAVWLDGSVDIDVHQIPGTMTPENVRSEFRNNVVAGNIEPAFFLTAVRGWDIRGNIFGMDINQENPISNQTNVLIHTSSLIFFGGDSPSDRNYIVSGTTEGLKIIRAYHSRYNGNYIGINASLADGFGNGRYGVEFEGSEHTSFINNRIYNSGSAGMKCKHIRNCTIRGNTLLGNNGPGIDMYLSNRSVVGYNSLIGNCSGIKMTNCGDADNPILAIGNYVENNTCNTGFHLEGSSAELHRNTVTGDESDGIFASNGSSVTMRENNIYDNAGYAVNNTDPGMQVDARGNFWGTGEERFSGLVDINGALQEMVTYSAGVTESVVSVDPGVTGSLDLTFQSLSGINASAPVTVSDALGWLTSPVSGTVETDGLEPGIFTAEYSVPEGTSDGTINEFVFTVTAEGEVLADTVTLIVYTPEIQELAVSPAWKVVTYGDSLALSAVGLDQYGQPMVVDPVWSVDAGTVDTLGVFVADSTEADVTVTAFDQISGLSGEALLLVRAAAPELNVIAVEPSEATIKTLDTLRFTAYGFDQYGQDHYTSVVWSAEGGVISEDGLFIADTLTGTFTVTASDAAGAITGTAEVTIEPRDPVSVEDAIVVTEYALYQNYPNPFNPSTTITYTIPEVSEVDVYVYNMLGELVRQFDEGIKPMGRFSLQFNAADLASGIYFYRIKAGRFHEVKKMLLVK